MELDHQGGASEAASAAIDWRLLGPVLIAACLLQVVVPLVRIATSYKVLAAGFSAGTIGLVSATFALLPMLLAVGIGRFVDAGGRGKAAVLGSLLIGLAALGLLLSPTWLLSLILFTALLGFGQALCLTALHIFSIACSGTARRDEVIGHFLLAFSVGHLVAPLMVSLLSQGQVASLGNRLLVVCCAGTVALVLAALALSRRGDHKEVGNGGERVPLSQLLRSRGLIWVILANSTCVTTNDLLLVYLPVLGAERGIEANLIGLLLTTRASFMILSRVVFARVTRTVERAKVIVVMMLVSAAALLVLAFPTPVWAMFAVMALVGFSIGIATASSLSLTLALAPVNARATMVSLRVTANRLGQFALPLAAGIVAVTSGAGGIMLVMAALLTATSSAVQISLRRP